jgi:hypothetical protein
MDMHRTTDRRTFIIDDSEKDIHRQTDRGRTFIDDSGMDMHRTTEDVCSSTDGGCTFIDDGRGSSGTQPSRVRRCGCCVGVGREREREYHADSFRADLIRFFCSSSIIGIEGACTSIVV